MLIRKNHPLIKIMNNVLIDLPSPPNISIYWNFGSLLGVTLALQLVTGLLLASRYTVGEYAFDSVILLMQDIGYGWLVRLFHATGASFFFLFVYFHMGRGLYYGSFKYKEVWNLGVIIYILMMSTAFLGYVLPWGQMSYWAATVITNLLSAIPYLGKMLVEWVWGGFAVSMPTLTRFYMLHYLLPFVILFAVVLHIFFLHQTGSTNPVGLNSSSLKVPFHYYYSVKDILGFMVFFLLFIMVSLSYGYTLMDSENFILANPLVTPTHIQPEWYFLFAYAILRSIPNKLGGVVALLCSVLVLFIFSFISSKYVSGFCFTIFGRLFFWLFVFNFFILTWLGMMPAQYPYTLLSAVSTVIYFLLILFMVWGS